ncbi:hypothetical protein JST99_03100 [Candidatus Dependentiae bacterium]|nr:hypothetical protein [Candidatus Dependentiae bacterium]MCC7414970.1 hypothetical protein [Campylobacterota bacterium]
MDTSVGFYEGNKGMLKKKRSKKQDSSLKNMLETEIKNNKGIAPWIAEESFLDFQKVGSALLECLINNDTQGYIEILDSYLRVNRLQVSKTANMPRSTVQLAFSKTGNPTLKTLAKIVHEASLGRR